MNTDVKYIYPVTRVKSIKNLLRTTRHNAFFVVTRMRAEKDDIEEESEDSSDAAFTPMTERTRRARQHRLSLLLTSGSTSPPPRTTKKRVQHMMEDEEQGDEEKPSLVFHGIILRSQLVSLFKHKVFFEEQNGVSQHTHIV